MMDSDATWAPALPVCARTAPLLRSTTLTNDVTPLAAAFCTLWQPPPMGSERRPNRSAARQAAAPPTTPLSTTSTTGPFRPRHCHDLSRLVPLVGGNGH